MIVNEAIKTNVSLQGRCRDWNASYSYGGTELEHVHGLYTWNFFCHTMHPPKQQRPHHVPSQNSTFLARSPSPYLDVPMLETYRRFESLLSQFCSILAERSPHRVRRQIGLSKKKPIFVKICLNCYASAWNRGMHSNVVKHMHPYMRWISGSSLVDPRMPIIAILSNI